MANNFAVEQEGSEVVESQEWLQRITRLLQIKRRCAVQSRCCGDGGSLWRVDVGSQQSLRTRGPAGLRSQAASGRRKGTGTGAPCECPSLPGDVRHSMDTASLPLPLAPGIQSLSEMVFMETRSR